MTIQHVIYDFDGTIADSWDEGIKVYNEIAARRGYTLITDENRELLRTKGWREVRRALRIPLLSVPLFAREMRRRVAESLPHVRMFEGIEDVLRVMHQMGCTQSIVTSNGTDSVKCFIQSRGIDVYIEDVIGDSSVLGKATKIKRLMRSKGMDPACTVYVGDEIRDIDAAHRAGIRAISVTWGANTEDSLRAHEPEVLVRSPEELIAWFKSQQIDNINL